MKISAQEWQGFLDSIRNEDPMYGARPEFQAKRITMRQGDASAKASMLVFFDVTGSMSSIPREFVGANGAMLTLTREIADRGSIPDPEIMFGAVGDVEYDRFPLQATEFNTTIEAARQLRQLYLEGGGGSNPDESYPAAWIFAARKTQPGSLRNGKKGILFTMGDELYPVGISGSDLARHLGITNGQAQPSSAVDAYYSSSSYGYYGSASRDAGYMTTEEMLAEAKEKYEIFHLCLKSDTKPRVFEQWKGLLGDKAIPVKENDIGSIAQIMVSIIDRYYAGMRQDQVADTWLDPSVSAAVAAAIANLGTEVADYVEPSAEDYNAQDSGAKLFLSTNGFSAEPTRINNFISSGFTPLTLAVSNANYAVSYDLVIRHEADINAKAQNGDTAMHIALRNYNKPNAGYKNITLWLAEAGAEMDARNAKGETPRKLAAAIGVDVDALISKHYEAYRLALV